MFPSITLSLKNLRDIFYQLSQDGHWWTSHPESEPGRGLAGIWVASPVCKGFDRDCYRIWPGPGRASPDCPLEPVQIPPGACTGYAGANMDQISTGLALGKVICSYHGLMLGQPGRGPAGNRQGQPLPRRIPQCPGLPGRFQPGIRVGSVWAPTEKGVAMSLDGHWLWHFSAASFS